MNIPGYKIVIISNNKNEWNNISQELEKRGYNISAEIQGYEKSVLLIDRIHPHLVILDTEHTGTITEQENVYGEKVPLEKFNAIFDTAIRDEYERHRILLALKHDSKSVKDLAKEIEVDSSKVLEHLLILKGRAQVAMEPIEGTTPYYVNVMEG